MKRRLRTIFALALVVVMAVGTTALAHPDYSTGKGRFSYEEDFPGEGVAKDKQHGGDIGHLPRRSENVRLVGKAEIADRTGAGITGRVADVTSHGNFAYLNAYFQPTCEETGVHVMNIRNLERPREVRSAFIPTTDGSFVGEGVQVIEMDNRHFSGDILIHQNETCGAVPEGGSSGGISMWDVSQPRDPRPIVRHVGDFTNPDGSMDAVPNDSHSMRAWYNPENNRWFVALIDNEEATDIDILNITNPREPKLINDTLDLADEPFSVGQDTPDNLQSVFSHDMHVERLGDRDVMTMNYWDGGYVLLDVTRPRAGRVTMIDESDFARFDEERLDRGHRISPEGNAHQSEFSGDGRFLIGTDEDFNPFRIFASITTGPYAGDEITAAQAGDTPPLGAEIDSIPSDTVYVGNACSGGDPVPPASGDQTALIERGGVGDPNNPAACTFQDKLDNIKAAGYTAGIVFNNVREDCLALVNMLAADEDVPFFFVNRLDGLKLLGVEGVDEENACTTETPALGSESADVDVRAEFDGWGYVRLFHTGSGRNSLRNGGGSLRQLDTYAIDESQDQRYASGFGDLSVHEVAMDPDENLGYISYYSGGFRVVSYNRNGIEEEGVFIDRGGNNFWGVEIHDRGGERYVLASDRDYGLYIFQYNPRD